MSGLVGYELKDGHMVCVDCDVYPPDATDVRQDHPYVAKLDARCDWCGQRFADIAPVSAALSELSSHECRTV